MPGQQIVSYVAGRVSSLVAALAQPVSTNRKARRTHLYKRTRARRMAVGARAQPILSAGIEVKVLFATADKNACPVSG